VKKSATIPVSEVENAMRRLWEVCASVRQPRPILEVRGGTIETLQMMRSIRSIRDRVSDLSDSGWRIIIDLALAARENRRVQFSSACAASGLPPTTGQRLLTYMVERGLVIRSNDPRDGRRIFVELSDEAEAMLEKFLDRAAAFADDR